MSEVTATGFLEYLVEHRAANLPPVALSEILDQLLWCLDDDGELADVTREWLRGDDRYRAEVALSRAEVFPFPTRPEMADAFAMLQRRWPDLRPKCESVLAQWDKQFKETERGK